jgi:hypothetical protein
VPLKQAKKTEAEQKAGYHEIGSANQKQIP